MRERPVMMSSRHCHGAAGLRSPWWPGSQGDEENQLLRIPVPARDHSTGDLALSPVHAELSRRRGFAGGTRDRSLLRDSPPLGEPLWTDDRGRLAQTPSKAWHDLASG